MNWTDNVVTRAMSRICDFMLLNLLWIICSIPVITIGASTAALYTVMLKLVKNEEGYIVKGFLTAFRDNFKKATIQWGILLAVGIIIGLDIRFAAFMQGAARAIFQSLFLVFAVIWLCAVIYTFPLTARYENTTKNTLKNALILSVGKLPYTLLMAIVTAGPVVLTLLNTRNLLIGTAIFIIIGVSLVAWVNSIILRRVFEIFHKDDD